jgi:FkbM family methyltransferase
MFDVLGSILRVTPHFRGKARLFRYWSRHLNSNEKRVAQLPDGSSVEVSMGVPYERMVWLEDEESDELEYLRRRLHKGEIFVDVGANIGLWTLVAASTVGREGRVFSFEPNPNTFQKLLRNIERNRWDAVVVPHQRAVSSECKPVSFYCAADHNISAIAPSDADTISVEAVTLDSVLSGVIAGIKLDTEGHELASLQGAARTIATSSPWLIVEFNTTLMPSNSLEDWEVYRYLGRMGYKPYIYEDAPGTEQRVDGSYSVKGYRNILFQR